MPGLSPAQNTTNGNTEIEKALNRLNLNNGGARNPMQPVGFENITEILYQIVCFYL